MSETSRQLEINWESDDRTHELDQELRELGFTLIGRTLRIQKIPTFCYVRQPNNGSCRINTPKDMVYIIEGVDYFEVMEG